MENNELGNLYRDAILDHCRNPRNHDPLQDPDSTGRSVNSFCGDEVEIQLSMDGGRVTGVGVQAVGCSINQASSSMMAEVLDGKGAEEAAAMAEDFRRMMLEGGDERELNGLGSLSALNGVREFPVRIKCALLPWSALKDALD